MAQRSGPLPSLMSGLFITGGVLMALLLIPYTLVHVPTSVDLQGSIYGRATDFWGSLLGGVPNILLATALVLLYYQKRQQRSKPFTIGFTLTGSGLLIPGAVDLLAGNLGPPLLMPLLGIGLILISAWGHSGRSIPSLVSKIWLFMGFILLATFLANLVPLEISDKLDGYRWFEDLAYGLIGLCWAMTGIILRWKRQS